MAELAVLANIQRMVYSEEVTRRLHVMVQARESSPVIDRRSNQLCYTPPTWVAEHSALLVPKFGTVIQASLLL